MRITVEAEVDLASEIQEMNEGNLAQLRALLGMDASDETINPVQDWIHRIKYKGLDTDLTALEVLEKIETELGY